MVDGEITFGKRFGAMGTRRKSVGFFPPSPRCKVGDPLVCTLCPLVAAQQLFLSAKSFH